MIRQISIGARVAGSHCAAKVHASEAQFVLQIIVFGRSLGGAVAFHVAATNPGKINSLIVENTFWSIEAVTGKVSSQHICTYKV